MRAGIAVACVAAVLAYAALSGLWVSSNSAWYFALQQPSWQPPNWVFGVIWPYNFVVLGIAAVLIPLRAPTQVVAVFLGFFGASVACAIAWAYLFYVPHNLAAAAIALSMAALLTIPILVAAFNAAPWLAVALLPYQLWVVIAASLSWGYVALASGRG